MGVVWSEQAEGALSTQEGITQSATGPCCREGEGTQATPDTNQLAFY